MAFSGYLIKMKNGNDVVELPLSYVKAESYSATPNQRLESSAARSTTGYLKRTTCDHTATKIEINTIPMTNTQWKTLWDLIKGKFSNLKQRNITLEYYDNESDSYQTGDFYMPDIEYPILRVDGNTIYYDSIRLAFIEY